MYPTTDYTPTIDDTTRIINQFNACADLAKSHASKPGNSYWQTRLLSAYADMVREGIVTAPTAMDFWQDAKSDYSECPNTSDKNAIAIWYKIANDNGQIELQF